MTKIDIYSGFLGAGKTTLIKKMVCEGYQKESIVLIENEFGEIGIDGGFLKDAGIQINEMNSGCICCSLVGDFKAALRKVLDEMKPDRIIIEPSGVGKLSDVIHAVKDIEGVTLNHYVTVVDAKKCKMYMKNFGEFFNNQIENASTIILSKTQDLDHDAIDAVVRLIQTKNDYARILTTPWNQLDGATIVEAMNASHDTIEHELLHDHDYECCHHDHDHHDHDHECCHHDHDHHDHDHECCHHDHDHHDHDHECCHHDHDHHHADDVFGTWSTQTTQSYTKEGLETILETLLNDASYGTILRAKGIVPGDDTWYYFDLVPGEQEIRTGQPDYTGRVVVIGTQLNKEKIEKLFIGEE